MNLVSQYVLRVGAYLIFSMLLEGVMPNGSSKKIVRLMISLVFMYVLVQPVVSWLEQEIPLAELTTVEIDWGEVQPLDVTSEYEKQAMTMVGQGYESMLEKQGLPKALEDQYQILEVNMGDIIKVDMTRNDPIGSLTDRSLNLGQIGQSVEEEETIATSLSEYWGIPQESLEIRLR